MKAAAAILLALALAAPAAAQAPPVATVDGSGEITVAQYRHWKEIARRSAPRSSEQALRRQVMQLLIQELWVEGEAAERGIAVSDAEVDRAFREQKRQSFVSRRAWRDFLRTSGFTVGDIKFRVRLEQLSNKLRRRAVRDVPRATEEELRAWYDENLEDFEVPERRDVRFAIAPTRAAASAKPKRLRVFALREQFPAAVFRRRGGVVRARGGWMAFRVVRVRPAHTRPFAEARGVVAEILEAQRQQEALDAFIRDFTARWKARTSCRHPYVARDCGRITR
jgi:foldase protein PrsA